MKNSFSRLLLVLTTVVSFGLAQQVHAGALNSEPQDVAYPKMVWMQKGFNYWAYFITKKIVVDIDKIFSDIGLRPAVCGFQTKNQDIHYYHQLGQCFFNAYLQHRNQPTEKIVVYSWLQDLSGKNISSAPLKIVWHRPDQSVWTTVKQYLQMKVENTFLESAKPVSMNFIAGSFSLYFPNNNLFQEILKGSVIGQRLGPFASVTNILQATHINLTNSGQRSEKNYMIYQGQLNLELRTQDLIHIDIETDVNLAKKKRPFYIHGKTNWESANAQPFDQAARKP